MLIGGMVKVLAPMRNGEVAARAGARSAATGWRAINAASSCVPIPLGNSTKVRTLSPKGAARPPFGL